MNINKPTQEVFNLVYEYQQKYSKIEWFKSEVNIKFKAIRSIIDYFNPKIFLYCEEDFILPESVREDYPYWPQQFAQLANMGAFVGWRANNMPKPFSNPFWVSTLFMKVPENPNLNYRWSLNYGPERFLAGYLMAIKSSIYKDIDKNLIVPTVDHHLSVMTKFEASPTTFGYHIGYNSNMDYRGYFITCKDTIINFRGKLDILDSSGKKHTMEVK